MSLRESVPPNDLALIAEAVFSSSFDSVMVTEASEKTPILYVNRAFTDLTGYSPEEVMGKSPSLLQGRDTDQAVIDQLRNDLAAGRNFEGKAINYRKDGEPFTMHWRVTPIHCDEKIRYFIAVQRKSH